MIAQSFEVAVQESVERRMRDPAQRQQVSAAIMQLFTNMRKKPVADLEQRTQEMQKRVDRAVEGMSVEFVRGELVIKVTGSAMQLLAEFRRGSDWFAPEPDVDKFVLAAILVDPTRS